MATCAHRLGGLEVTSTWPGEPASEGALAFVQQPGAEAVKLELCVSIGEALQVRARMCTHVRTRTNTDCHRACMRKTAHACASMRSHA